MKNILLLLSVLSVSACSKSVTQIGSFNVVSTRNYSNKEDYKLLSTYSGSSVKELKKSRHQTVDDAVSALLKKVPYGEFLANVKLYRIGNSYYAVSGDVWGLSSAPVSSLKNSYGYSLGDSVSFVDFDVRYVGAIVSFVDDEYCRVSCTTGKTVRRKYSVLTRLK